MRHAFGTWIGQFARRASNSTVFHVLFALVVLVVGVALFGGMIALAIYCVRHYDPLAVIGGALFLLGFMEAMFLLFMVGTRTA
jgi:uncharacterized membrane protein YgdD (TMEM256/DUF423 family)